ncbi:MAG: chromate transporter, partial [Alphaproteobacteria bacterium]|nr:chromate transporter [Alphaproteobacteria bacterium]
MLYSYNSLGQQKRVGGSISKRCWILFTTFFKVALFVVGGGLAMLPVIEDVFVRKRRWMTKDETLDMIVLTQTIPGLVAVNSALYVGKKIAGIRGALSALLGVMLPSIVLILLIAFFFPDLDTENKVLLTIFSAVRACVTGVLVVTAWRLAWAVIHNEEDFFIIAVFTILLICGVNPLYI